MKLFIALLTMTAAAFSTHAAETSVTLANVHLCCQSCAKGAQKAVASVKDVTATVDQDAETVTLTGPDTATVQKAADALVQAGFFGKSSNADVKLTANTGAKGKKVQTLKVQGVHLCCGKCVKAVNESLSSVAGVKANTATKGAKSFEVTGDFNDKEVFDALHKSGLTGRVE